MDRGRHISLPSYKKACPVRKGVGGQKSADPTPYTKQFRQHSIGENQMTDEKIIVDVFGSKDADIPDMARFGVGSTDLAQVQADLDRRDRLRDEQSTAERDVRRDR
jgi:hypothetical protein